MRKFLLASAALAAFTASPASAAVVFSDGFEGDAPGLNVNPLANWTVMGQVDVVTDPNVFGITIAAPASGNVVDLDGSPGPGEITMKNAVAFGANEKVTLSFVLGGSQRVGPGVSDDFFSKFIFAGAQEFSGGVGTGILAAGPGSGVFAPTYSTFLFGYGSGTPFGVSSYSFIAKHAGSIKLAFGTASADNIGPLLDNVSISVGAIPEPATWAMMIMGFGLIGGALRSHKSVGVRFAAA
jgi:PEP-CTERM motif